MRRLVPLLLALGACDTSGTIDITDDGAAPDGDTDGVPDPSDTDGTTDPSDTDGPDDPGDPSDTDDTNVDVDPDPEVPDDDPEPGDAVEPTACGPFRRPPSDVTGASRTFGGDAVLLDQSGSWGGDTRTWTGCEVERRFDADGFLTCEVVWAVTTAGNGNKVPVREIYRYELDLKVDASATTCPGAADKKVWAQAEIARNGTVTVGRRTSAPDWWDVNPSYTTIGSFASTVNGDRRSFAYHGSFRPE